MGLRATQGHETRRDYRAILRRRRWSLVLPTLLGLLVGIALAALLLREYTATATLAVTSPATSGGETPSTEADQGERLRAVSQELLSSAVVEQVAEEEGLVGGGSIEKVVIDIRRRTRVAVPPKSAAATNWLEPDTFLVSYTEQSPDLAQRVVNRLVQVFVERHSRLRETRAEESSAVLEQQLNSSRERLVAAESRLRDAKTSFRGRLPEQESANLQSAAELRQRLESNTRALAAEREQLAMLEQQVDVARVEAHLAASAALEARIDERLAVLEQQLADARRQYTDLHPDVQKLMSDVERARAESAQEREQARSVAPAPSPALRALTADRERARLRIKELQAADARTREELGRYQGRLDEAPLVEQQLQSVSEAYELEKQQHQKLSDLYQTALLSEDPKRRQAAERFVVLNPAQRPLGPSSPNFLLVVGIPVLVGGVLGSALAMAREFMDRSMHDRRTLEAEFGRPVLAEIPHF